jgi:hypothetical protein
MTRNRTKVWDLNYVTVIMSATTKLRRELLRLGDRSLVLAVRLSHHVAVRRSRDLVV